MMKFIPAISLSLILLFISNISAQVWRVSTPYNGAINDIVFTDNLTGYASGIGAGIGNCTGSGLLLKTIDGGSTWTRMNTVTTNALNKLFFKDAFTGWALGNSSTVLKTIDGGVNWIQQTSGIGAGLNDIYFIDFNTGFICGLNGILRKTTNGGTNFTTIASGVTTTLYGVHFVNNSLGFIIGDNGVIRKTINGGGSFSSVYSGTDAFRDVYFFNDSVGFVLSPYKILKTINGGSSWTVYNADPSWIMTRMFFVSTKTGFIIGDSGLLLKTTDGGVTWNPLAINTTAYLRSIFFTDENTGYIGRDLGNIYKSTDGGSSWNSILSGLSEEIFSIQFRNRALGIAVGADGGIYHTKNGGLNWTHRNNQTYSYLNCVRWLTNEKVIAAGGNGTIVKSDDAGMNWYSLQTGIHDQMYDIHVVDSSNVYITFGTGKLLKTTDGCVNWDTTLNTGSSFPLTGVYFINADTGYGCGDKEIYRTYNGGNSWVLKNDSVQMFTSFNDIFFPGKDTGYVAGTFGKLYRTINGGEWWHAMYPPSTANAEINEMQFFNNDTGYFAGSVSQRVTYNDGGNLTVMPTACLANNWETHSISRPEEGYAFCAGGQSGLLHTLQKDSMLATYLQDSIFCSGSRIFVGYLASGLLLSTQVLDVQLSDAIGNFSTPTIIGTFQLYTPMIDPSGIATCLLPPGLNGTGYRIRIVCNSPQLISPDNGYDITIHSSVTPYVNLSALDSDLCQHETLRFLAQATGGGANPSFNWTLDNTFLDWQAGMIPFDTLESIHVLKVVMTSSLSCAISSATDSIQFEVFQKPVVDAGIDQSICVGASILIGTANNTGTYLWSPAIDLNDDTIAMPEASPHTSQSYVLSTTNIHGCTGRDTVNVLVNQLPVIDITGNALLCVGDSALLIAGSLISDPHFQWSPAIILSADTGNSVYALPVTDATIYASITDDSMCVNTDSIRIHMLPAAGLPDLTIVNTSLVVTGITQNLEWYLNGFLISGFSNDTLFNPADGTYMVKVTDSNGCSAWSQEVIYSVSGIKNVTKNSVVVFYSDGIIQIKATCIRSESIKLNLFDACGRIVFNKTIQLDNAGFGVAEIKNISMGIYFTGIKIDGVEKVSKIIVL